MENEVILSILVPVYNHEDYIEEALDSILMQETKYEYEVLAGEDKSEDSSREILKKYEMEHPGKIRVLYREKNLFKERIDNITDLLMRGKGKYLIILEGDDFWTDKRKIEKQISFLERHPEYAAVAHNCVVVDKNSAPVEESYPECKEHEYTFGHYASDIFPGQTASVMFRNIFRNPDYDSRLARFKLSPGDRKMAFSLLCNGKIFCIQEVMSAYRHITDEGSSYSAFNTEDELHAVRFCAVILNYAYKINNERAVKAAEIKYIRALRIALQKRMISLRQFIKYTRHLRNRKASALLMLKRDYNRFILRREVSVNI